MLKLRSRHVPVLVPADEVLVSVGVAPVNAAGAAVWAAWLACCQMASG